MTSPASDPNFMECLPHTLIQECPYPNDWSNPKNFSNDAHDPGGATMCGIIQTEYNSWRKAQSLPVQPVQLLTMAEGYAIYYQNYWIPECPKLPPGMDLQFFDAAVNEGVTEATKILQYVHGIPVDGIWGPQTDDAVQAKLTAAVSVTLIKAFTARREAVYRMFAGYQYFGNDWERRSAEIGSQAVAMAQA